MSQISVGLTKNKPFSVYVLFSILLIVFLSWMIIIRLSYPVYQNHIQTQPFAELSSLFPLYFLLIACYGIFSFWVFYTRAVGKYSSFAIIILWAIIIWYTPYAMTGFVKQNDTIWHMGMAANAPEILDGASMPFSSYVLRFPGSYLLGFVIIETTGADLVVLANYILPLFFTFLFVSFFFILFSKLFDLRTSSMATMGAIVLLHYVAVHFSPQIIGITLLFSGIFLILKNRYPAAIAFGFVLMFTHIVSFVLFGLFIVIAIAVKYVKPSQHSRKELPSKNKIIILISSIVIVILVVLLKYLHFNFARVLNTNVLSFALIYIFDLPWFKLIALLIYGVITIVFLFILTSKIKIFSLNSWKSMFLKVESVKVIFILFSIASLIFAIITAAIERGPVLIERGLFFFLPIIFGTLFWYITEKSQKTGSPMKTFSVILLAFILVYPICSYTIDSYNNFPKSEGVGLQFIAFRCEINNRTVDQSVSGQIDAFITPDVQPIMNSISVDKIDFLIYRKTVDFKYQLHNSENPLVYYSLYANYDNNRSFSKIYSNPNFIIYLQSRVII